MAVSRILPPPTQVDANDWTWKKWFQDIYLYNQGGILVPNSNIMPVYSSNRNVLINGDFQIWQRGTSFTVGAVAKAFGPDKWTQGRGSVAGSTMARGTVTTTSTDYPLPKQFKYYCRCQRTAGDTSTADVSFGQAMESNNVTWLRGKTVVLSFWARKGSGFAGDSFLARIFTGTGTNENVSSGMTGRLNPFTATVPLSTTWKFFQYYGTIDIGANSLSVLFSYHTPSNATAAANEYFDITGVQLEIARDESNPVATAFDYQPFDVQHVRCSRYFQKSFSYATTPAQNAGDAGVFTLPCIVAGSGVNNTSTMSFQGKMATTPTFTFYNPHAANALAWNYQRSNSSTAISTNGLGEGTTAVAVTGVFGSWVVGDLIGFHWTADADF